VAGAAPHLPSQAVLEDAELLPEWIAGSGSPISPSVNHDPAPANLTRPAVSATLRCLTGCAIAKCSAW
jgi:hypothetical protein